jgi:Tol biopolymer transport system component
MKLNARLATIGAPLIFLVIAPHLPADPADPAPGPKQTAVPANGRLGIFSEETDVGGVAKAGSAVFDSTSGEYRITGGGDNMWATNDAFHFVWTKLSGDLKLAARVQIVGTNGNAHRKACLIIRQSLAPDAIYVDVACHGNGLTALQYREAQGGVTREIQSNISAPDRVQIEKRGEYFSIALAASGDTPQNAGGYLRVPIQGEFEVGLGVCAHDNQATEQAVFSDVQLTPLTTAKDAKPRLECTLEVVPIGSTDRTVVYRTAEHIEAPNWTRDGKFLLFNQSGRIYRLPVNGGAAELIDTGGLDHCNNDHGLSPDGASLAISDSSKDGQSRVYIVPLQGGVAREITPLSPSYWHGWSPDGRTLAFCGQRNGEFDVYTIPADGGEEQRLTTAAGLDDGPDYSPDGKFIYFNSERTGRMQIWRMKADGAEQEQVTNDDYNNWFAHPSPDGKWIAFLSYEKDVTGHPANKDVWIRLMGVSDHRIQLLAKIFGGQGTMNVPSWSPDSRQVAFVSYQMIYP